MRMVDSKRKILASSLLVLFVVYYVNITFFPHSHQVGDFIIIHSHYYSGTTTTSQPVHSHTAAGFALINGISLFLSLAVILPILLVALNEAIHNLYVILTIARPVQEHFRILLPRAPPVLIGIG